MRSAAPNARKASRIQPATSGGSWVAARLFGIGRAGVVCGACCWEVAGGAAEDSAGASGAVGVDGSLAADDGSVAAEEVEGSIGATAVVLELP